MAPGGRPRTALLIEDARLDYVGLRKMLLDSDVGIVTLDWMQDCAGAEAVLQRGPYDLYLVDIYLGAVSGLDVIAQLRTSGILAPIIALTGHADDQIDRACTAAGASDFLVKGQFDNRALERSIRYATRSAVIHDELERMKAVLERRMSAEAEQARLMRFAMEQSTDGMFICRAESSPEAHTAVYANAAFCAMMGRRSGELLGSPMIDLFAPAAHAAAARLTQALAAGDSQAVELDLSGRSPALRASVRASPLRSAGGDITHFIFACRDSGEQNRRADAERHRQGLQAAGQMAMGPAHDFSNLLTAVLGNLELLARRVTDDKTRALVTNAMRAAERGVRLAEQLREADRPHPQAPAGTELGGPTGGMDDLLPAAVPGGMPAGMAVDNDA